MLENTHAIFVEHLQYANQRDWQSISLQMKFSASYFFVYQPIDLVVSVHLKLKSIKLWSFDTFACVPLLYFQSSVYFVLYCAMKYCIV